MSAEVTVRSKIGIRRQNPDIFAGFQNNFRPENRNFQSSQKNVVVIFGHTFLNVLYFADQGEAKPWLFDEEGWQGPSLHYIALRRIEFKGCQLEVIEKTKD